MIKGILYNKNYNIKQHISIEVFRRKLMRVVALVGKSGTGKSYKALALAHEKEIDYIIDDGLFIKGNKIIAGKSAKREKTKISAVKRALFMEKRHKEAVIEKLHKSNPRSVLILGTSEKMVNQISENLRISPINEFLNICSKPKNLMIPR